MSSTYMYTLKKYNWFVNDSLLNELYLYNKLMGNWFYFHPKKINTFKFNNFSKLKLLNLKVKFKSIVENFFLKSISYKKKKKNRKGEGIPLPLRFFKLKNNFILFKQLKKNKLLKKLSSKKFVKTIFTKLKKKICLF